MSKGGKFKWDIAMPPFNGKPVINLYGASVSIYKTTPEKELAAWLVIKFLGEKAQTTRWAVQTGYLPVRLSAKDDVIKPPSRPMRQWGPVADSYAKMFDWAPYSTIESPVAGYDPVRALIDTDLVTQDHDRPEGRCQGAAGRRGDQVQRDPEGKRAEVRGDTGYQGLDMAESPAIQCLIPDLRFLRRFDIRCVSCYLYDPSMRRDGPGKPGRRIPTSDYRG